MRVCGCSSATTTFWTCRPQGGCSRVKDTAIHMAKKTSFALTAMVVVLFHAGVLVVVWFGIRGIATDRNPCRMFASMYSSTHTLVTPEGESPADFIS